MPGELVKVLFELPVADWYSAATETLWATPLGDGQYRLENSPFYASGYSFLDVIFAEFDPEQGFPVVRRALKKSGHSTYALWVINGIDSNGMFAAYWEPIEKLGCSFEGIDGKLLSVDVPPGADIHEAFHLMESGKSAGVWDFQEQDVGHAV
ncbi:MAG: DUF4265 domain-containing protein [Betaproteobacteria bacterium]